MTVFLDTNVLVYAQGEGPKSEIARRVVYNGGVISVQVLNEFVSVSRRRLKYEWKQITEAVSDLRVIFHPVGQLSMMEAHINALAISASYEFNIYDSLIIASALQARCSILLTEDLQAGQVIDSVTIVNPFANGRTAS